eukprot:GHRQ01027715.1.p1 GENE.GHRQ01027715.1~~GHRQ01027715.1.p1  ORF type:complete len:227 (+),score=112.66 GHRQ01027715.1:3-683(+)
MLSLSSPTVNFSCAVVSRSGMPLLAGCSLGLLWQLLQPRLPQGMPALTHALKRHLWHLLRDSSSQLSFSTEELMQAAREAAETAGPVKKKKKKQEADEEQQQISATSIMREAVPEDAQQAEAAGIILLAAEAARHSVLGVYDWQEANNKLSEHQLGVLEMAGQGRHHGAVQTNMANALGVQHRNFFYVLKVSFSVKLLHQAAAHHRELCSAGCCPSLPAQGMPDKV